MRGFIPFKGACSLARLCLLPMLLILVGLHRLAMDLRKPATLVLIMFTSLGQKGFNRFCSHFLRLELCIIQLNQVSLLITQYTHLLPNLVIFMCGMTETNGMEHLNQHRWDL